MLKELSPELQEVLSMREQQRWVNRGLLRPDCPECCNGILMLPPVRYKGQIGPNRICSNCGKGFIFPLFPASPDRWYIAYELEIDLEHQKEQWVKHEVSLLYMN